MRDSDPVVRAVPTARPHVNKLGSAPKTFGLRRSIDWERMPPAEASRLIVRLWRRRDRRLFGPERPGD